MKTFRAGVPKLITERGSRKKNTKRLRKRLKKLLPRSVQPAPGTQEKCPKSPTPERTNPSAPRRDTVKGSKRKTPYPFRRNVRTLQRLANALELRHKVQGVTKPEASRAAIEAALRIVKEQQDHVDAQEQARQQEVKKQARNPVKSQWLPVKEQPSRRQKPTSFKNQFQKNVWDAPQHESGTDEKTDLY